MHCSTLAHTGPGASLHSPNTMQVTWADSPNIDSFQLQLHFGTNATHWHMQQARVLASGLIAQGLDSDTTSSHSAAHGHAIAAPLGTPFECHYLELPLKVVGTQRSHSAGSSSASVPLGAVAGDLKLHDFAMVGWQMVGSAVALRNRLDALPCGTRQYAPRMMQACLVFLVWKTRNALHRCLIPSHVIYPRRVFCSGNGTSIYTPRYRRMILQCVHPNAQHD